MFEIIERTAFQFGIETQTLVLTLIGVGAALSFYGFASAVTHVDPATERLAKTRHDRLRRRRDKAILTDKVETSKGVLSVFTPSNPTEMNSLKILLIQAGYRKSGAVRTFTLVRVLLGFGLPLCFAGALWVSQLPEVFIPYGVGEWLAGRSAMGIFQLLTVLTFAGFFFPLYVVSKKAKETRMRITESFPNALDLLQVSVEAGLGFDTAMTRVGNELASVSPELAVELLTVQRQIQAGRPRDAAMREMAERTGVEMVQSFAKVVQQSMQFGTPLTEALQTYADEMRMYRELAAQEMANKLPVKMSVVLATFMLPSLVLMTVGPTIIRYLNFSGS